VVIGRNVDRGQTVAASLEAPTLFTIAKNLHEMEVHAKVDEADIGAVRVGQRAAFSVDAFVGRRFEAEVVQIRKAPAVVENVVTYTVVLSTRNPELLLLPGMTAVVRIVVATAGDVLAIPNAALRFRPPPSLARADGLAKTASGAEVEVWTVDDDGRLVAVRVVTGISDARMTELVSGPLAEGQPVVTGVVDAAPRREGWFGLRLGL
jgi:HlyD family secretion protein